MSAFRSARWILIGLFTWAGGMSACLGATQSAPQPGPNVLLVLTDDQGWGDVRSHGNDRIDTPVMDRIAAEGAQFDRFFVSPLCAPTRAALLTGRDHLRTGATWVTHRREVMRAEEVTIAEVLGAAGYAAGCFGKWHNGAQFPTNPAGQGFQEFFGFLGGGYHNYFDALLEHDGKTVQTKGYITDVLTDAAIKFIGKHRDRPFFCYVPYNACHSPFQVLDRYFDKYKNRGFNDKDAAVYGMVENIDDNLGRLLAKLDELDLDERTIVVFLTDNGPNGARFNGGMRGTKGSVHEGGVRVPCFIRWKGRIAPGTQVEQIAAHIDLLPTLAELCGAEIPGTHPPLDGRSLVPLLMGESVNWPDRTIFTINNRAEPELSPGAARTQQYRLVRTGRRYELYDMIADPEQRRDIAESKPEVVERLAEKYEQWFAEASRGALHRPPIPVGYAEADTVEITSPEAYLVGDLHFATGPGWTTDWMTGWSKTQDYVWWDLDVVRSGRYLVSLKYACSEHDAGAKLQVRVVGGGTIERVLDQPFDTGLRVRPERTAKSQRHVREFTDLELGEMDLPEGQVKLELRALTKPGRTVCELRGLILRHVE